MRILLIEDNPGDARLVQELLKQAGEKSIIEVVEYLESGVQFLLSQDVDAVLLDMNLPDSRGLETLTKVQSRFPHLPIVVMTSIDDTELAAQAVRLGAQDYLVKGQADGELLRRSLIYAIERKRSEMAVLQAKEEWELTFNSVPDLIVVLDCQHRIIRANKAMADRLGVNQEKCAGLPCFEAVHGLSYPPEFCPHSLTCQDGKEHITDVHEPRLGGDFSVSTTPIINKQGVITGSIHVARDITDRKRAEEDLKRNAAALEAANKELEAFSYSVSHDLRAPLRSMDGFSEALLTDYNDKLEETGIDYLNRIRQASQTMSQLIDDILKLSRVTRSDMRLDKVNLSELASSIAAELKAVQPDREAEFIIVPDLIVNADKQLLQVLLRNLLENAWKYTGKCSKTRIELGVNRQDGQTVYFVKDNGIGFDMKYADKLFQPFQRLQTSKEYPGTGIGLATVQRVVRRHGGSIRAESEAGNGATFYFTLQ
jgi:PAS domain S-box-containing protein